jgi:hypothetical protein
MTHLRHLHRHVDAKSTTVLLLHRGSISPTSNDINFPWRLKCNFPFVLTRWERGREWNSNTLFSETLSSHQRILSWDRRKRKDMGAKRHKKLVELLSARLLWSDIWEKGVNLKKSQVEKTSVECPNLKLE